VQTPSVHPAQVHGDAPRQALGVEETGQVAGLGIGAGGQRGGGRALLHQPVLDQPLDRHRAVAVLGKPPKCGSTPPATGSSNQT
jgi:hypothetical protein